MTKAIELTCPACGALVGVWCGCQARNKAAAKLTRDANRAARAKAQEPIAAIVDHDGNDENDYPSTDAEWTQWLKLQLARPVSIASCDEITRVVERARRQREAETRLKVSATRPTMPDDDPGDTDHSYHVRRIDVGADGKITAEVE